LNKIINRLLGLANLRLVMASRYFYLNNKIDEIADDARKSLINLILRSSFSDLEKISHFKSIPRIAKVEMYHDNR
jgi:hypothetical protein